MAPELAKRKRWKISTDRIYDSNFVLQSGGLRRDAFRYTCATFGIDPDAASYEESSSATATFFPIAGGQDFGIWLRDQPSKPTHRLVATIAHEAVHAARHVLAHVGVPGMDKAIDEVYAYYVGYVVREICGKIWPEEM